MTDYNRIFGFTPIPTPEEFLSSVEEEEENIRLEELDFKQKMQEVAEEFYRYLDSVR